MKYASTALYFANLRPNTFFLIHYHYNFIFLKKKKKSSKEGKHPTCFQATSYLRKWWQHSTPLVFKQLLILANDACSNCFVSPKLWHSNFFLSFFFYLFIYLFFIRKHCYMTMAEEEKMKLPSRITGMNNYMIAKNLNAPLI